MKRHTVFGICGFITGALLGSLLSGIPLGALLLKSEHHYGELEVFFKGKLGNREVRGVSYFDYHGIGFMESNQWKVEILRPGNPDPTTIYHGRPVFQEALPRQPTVSIASNAIRIDDGEQVLTIQVTDDRAEQADAANRHPFGTSADPASRAGAKPEASGDS